MNMSRKQRRKAVKYLRILNQITHLVFLSKMIFDFNYHSIFPSKNNSIEVPMNYDTKNKPFSYKNRTPKLSQKNSFMSLFMTSK